jgi:hypothetical protein
MNENSMTIETKPNDATTTMPSATAPGESPCPKMGTSYKTPAQVLTASTIDAEELRQALLYCDRNKFEEWVVDLWLNNSSAYAAEKTVHESLCRAGLPTAPERIRQLEVWGEQVRASLPLAAAGGDSAHLDYSNPLVLCYFCLWLQHGHTFSKRSGRVDWKAVLAPDLWCLAMS